MLSTPSPWFDPIKIFFNVILLNSGYEFFNRLTTFKQAITAMKTLEFLFIASGRGHWQFY